jgi:hypothetical protein
MAKRRKPELPPDPAGHQAARLPAQWSEIDQAELERRHRQAALLVAKGHGAISWSEVLGER